MAIKIRNNASIKGIIFENHSNDSSPFKVLQYADDTTLLLKDENELLAALDDIEHFSSFSGLKLNRSKSLGMWIGSSKSNTNTPGDISWVKCGESIKILGIFFCATKEASSLSQNWDNKVDKIRQLVHRWQRRQLSMYGKILICKTFLISQLAYTIQALVPPEKILNTLDSIIFKFIWQKKHSNKKAFEKIKRKVMCQSVSNGGLSMISIKTQSKLFQLKWIRHLIEAKIQNRNENNLIDCIFKNLGGFTYFLSFSTKLKETDLPQNMTKFWKSVALVWSDFKHNENLTEEYDSEQMLSQPLFFNKHIIFRGRTLYFHTWVRKGLKFVFQFIGNGQWKSKKEVEEKVNGLANTHFEYYALLNGISHKMNKALSSQSEVLTTPHKFNVAGVIRKTLENSLKLINLSNVILRQKLIGGNVETCGRNFWLRKTGFDINPNYKMANFATKESRLRLLHFKILHNIYPSNILLRKMGIKDSDLCDFCKERDVVEHMFINCKLLEGFWSMVFITIYNHTNESFSQSDNAILFGYNYDSIKVAKEKTNIANHILLIAKLSISKFRYGKIKNLNYIFESEINLRKKYLSQTDNDTNETGLL